MARQVLLALGDEQSAFDIAKLDRSKLYGTRRRMVVDEDGRECARGLLSEDGSMLLPPGCTADLYLDEGFDVVERSTLKVVDAEGNLVPPVESTLGVAVPLTEVPYSQLLDHVTPVVYMLDGTTLGPNLQAALAAGKVFEGRFAYKDGFDLQILFLVQNDTGVYALIGQPTGFDFVRRDTPPPAPEEEQEDLFEDDLDFGMM